jgi:hypothetical protein
MARDETFLSRWSRLKQAERREAGAPEPAKAALPPAVASEAKDETPKLPSIDSLTKDSDFTVFMKAGVPDALRNLALRKLWESDPTLYAHDGLTDYGADYAKIMREGEGLAETAYKVGRGFLEKGDLPWEKDEADAEAKAAVPAAGSEPPALPATPPAAPSVAQGAPDPAPVPIENAPTEGRNGPEDQAKRTEKLG